MIGRQAQAPLKIRPQLGAPRSRRVSRGRLLLRDLSWVLMIAGTLLLVDAGMTLAWQEPLTALVAVIRRGEIDHRFQTARGLSLPMRERRAYVALPTAAQKFAFLARFELRALRNGDAIGRIAIPRIGLSIDVVQGTDHLSLEKGPGHYPGTALPGIGETVAIAGHRTTYLAPFRHIDDLRPGDPIVLTMPYGRFDYTVQYTRIVLPTSLWVTRDVGYDRLVLSACNPLYSAAQRIVVFARLVRAVALPSNAARGPSG